MGADGGTIPKRCELVKNKKKAEKLDKNCQNAAKWRTCQGSNQPLRKPVIACRLGRLYNKEAILEGLINKTLNENELTKHIKSRHDFKELRLTENKAYGGDGPNKGNTYIDYNETKWMCPVTALPMNGKNVFIVNFGCGCVVSEKAMSELKESTNCLSCNAPLDKEQLVQLYPEPDLLATYVERLATEQAARKAKKAEKKADDAKFVRPDAPTTSAASQDVPKTNGVAKTNGVLKAKSEAQKRKAESIQDDPKVSKAVKSMFTTSAEAQNQPKGHWVTHNPLYF